MGVCISPTSLCQDKNAAINVHKSIGLSINQSISINEQNTKNKICPNYHIKDIGYKIKISLIFFCNNEILKNSFTYKFKLFIDNSDMEEENFIILGSTEATICQSQIKFQKIFETHYFFSKGQRIKICCLENEKTINTSLFYLGKMINGFENPKLIIEKDNNIIGELLILINKENNFKNKRCNFFVEINNLSKFLGKGCYFFTINKNSGEVLYSTDLFNSESTNTFQFYFQIRKHIIFDKSKYFTFNLYKIKDLDKDENKIKNNPNNEIKDLENKEKKTFIIENELIDSIKISQDELIANNGINIFSMNKGIFSYILSESLSLKIYYIEKEYTSFIEYISCQLRLNLILILNKGLLKRYTEGIKYIINMFYSLMSLYNLEEQKLIYLKNQTIQKANNYIDFYDDIINDENEIIDNKDIFPDIDYLYNNYIFSEMNKGMNKYFITLIFTDQKFNDLNSDNCYLMNYPNHDIYNNSPISFKIFNFGDKNNYIEKNDININIFKSINDNMKYNRLLFQFYNVNNEINDKKKCNKYLNDIPYLIEDFFEIQKMAEFSIFDD